MKVEGRKGAKRAKIGVILTLKMAKNGPKIPNISMEKGVKVLILMFLCQTYVILISWNKNSQMWRIWGI